MVFLEWSIDSLRTADVSPRPSPLREVSRGGTSTTQRQKFHADDVNQCLQINQVVMGSKCKLVQFLLVDFGKGLCSSANELQLRDCDYQEGALKN